MTLKIKLFLIILNVLFAGSSVSRPKPFRKPINTFELLLLGKHTDTPPLQARH